MNKDKIVKDLGKLCISGKYDTSDCVVLKSAAKEIQSQFFFVRENLKNFVKQAMLASMDCACPKGWATMSISFSFEYLVFNNKEKINEECASRVADFLIENQYVLVEIIACNPKRHSENRMAYDFYMSLAK